MRSAALLAVAALFLGVRGESCEVCRSGGDSSCRLISGLFTKPTLNPGYNLVAQIPVGACNVTVSEMRSSRNYLALRRSDGSFVVNGNWAINFSGEYDGFSYSREDPETITAAGPITQPVDIMIIYQSPNPGIKYEYSIPVLRRNPVSVQPTGLPDDPKLSKEQENPDKRNANEDVAGDEARRTRVKKRKFSWKVSGYTQCSRSCGGGVQTTLFACVREKDQAVVPDARCLANEKPPVQMSRCNVKPCPAEWLLGEWSECSATCGEGVQTRALTCQQEVTATLTMKVADGACPLPPPPRARPCHAANPCPGAPPTWLTGPWSQCSSTCGHGTRMRSITCSGEGCPENERPAAKEECDSGPCHATWLRTEWTQQCSEGCGTGVQTRKVACSDQASEHCELASKPEESRACSSDKQCGGQWFAGPWGQCSSDCGSGRQRRAVACVAVLKGQHRVVLDLHCPPDAKPEPERDCEADTCIPNWYFSDWTQCSSACEQRREVRCLDGGQQPSAECDEETRPPTKRPCDDAPCPAAPGKAAGPECTDTFPNCRMVVQARLCRYKYYHHGCCLACKSKQ